MSYMKPSSSCTSSKDILAPLMEHCKTTYNDPEKSFIRRVEGAPEPICVVCTEVAFSDLERFCCKAPQGLNSVMTVDPTFNFGEFYFTPITFKNLAVHRKLTGQPKIDMGPALFHQRKVFSSYHYFSSSLVGISPGLNERKCFGTDGEHNLASAFAKSFPFADQLRCFTHSKRNVKERLNTLPAPERNIIIQDKFGKVEGTHKYEGLVHAADTDIFIVLTESIKDQWNSIELPNLPAIIEKPSFHSWFVKNIAPYMGKHIVTNIREKNGLSCDFSTNCRKS